MNGQPRRASLLEAFASTATGFIISYSATFAIMPLFGLHTNASQNFWIVMIYTVISIVRQYIWRRIFNWLQWRAL